MLNLNNKGQTLVMFIILLPILLFVLTLVYDVGNAIYEKDKLSNTNYMVVEYALRNSLVSEDELVELINKNDDDISDITIMMIDNSVTIALTKDIKGVFGKMFGFNLTSVRSEYRGNIIQGEKKIERIKWYYGRKSY